MKERDYSEASKSEFDMEIQLEAFGFNCVISIEGITSEYHNKYHNGVSNKGKAKMGFHSQFSDESYHNAATKFENIKKFIHWIYENNLFIKYGIIYYTTYGCIKQYMCANEMWILSVLAFTYRVIIDIFVNSPGRGRRNIYSINGSNKTHFKNIYA